MRGGNKERTGDLLTFDQPFFGPILSIYSKKQRTHTHTKKYMLKPHNSAHYMKTVTSSAYTDKLTVFFCFTPRLSWSQIRDMPA